ncbi:MAG: hypothetical protein ACRDPO_26665 [Streptosporangiaceae bacterium]
MTAASEPADPVLARRYQRLLAWYPPRHRAAHGEEMLGVLLAAAPEGQRRPRITEAVNLLWGALLIWLRPRSAAQPAGTWSDALAAFSVAAPLGLLAWFTARTLTEMTAGLMVGWSPAILVGLVYSTLGLALPFVLLGLRRTAAVICCAATLLLAYVASRTVAILGGAAVAIPLFLYAIESVALLGSPGPRRGWRVLTWPAWAAIAVAAVAAGVLQAAGTIASEVAGYPWARAMVRHPYLAGWIAVAAAAAAVLALTATVVARRSALGQRVLLLFAIPAYACLVTGIWFGLARPLRTDLVTYVPPLVLVAGVALAAIRRGRHERRGRRGRRDGPDADADQAARA